MDTCTQAGEAKRQYRGLAEKLRIVERDVSGRGVGGAGSASTRSECQPGFQLAQVVSSGATG
jgi:hypothetical protein